jgi:TonB family protein
MLRGRLYHWTGSCAYCVPLRSGVGERGHNRIVRFRQGVVSTGLVLLVLGTRLQRTAFSQESTQQAITRKIKAKVDPRYPELARQYQFKGKVRIEATVSPDGSVKKTRVVGGSPLLAGAALGAVKQWKYEPGPNETVETINFSIE